MKQNCWEFKKCGREPGGNKVEELGVCPASIDERADGINSGKNAGRTCWVKKGTLCDKEVQGTFSQKIQKCMQCDFYHAVFKEEGDDFMFTDKVLEIIEE